MTLLFLVFLLSNLFYCCWCSAEGVIENARKDRSLLVEPVELAHTQALQLQEQNLHIASVQRRLAEERAVAEEAATKAAKITAQFEEV